MDRICKEKIYGGLGVKNISLFNKTIFGKWKWSLFHEGGGLWKEVLISKYGGWRSLHDDERLKKCSIWWTDIAMTCGGEDVEGTWFESMKSRDVESGRNISFWNDNWLNGISLAHKYSRLYANSCQQKCEIAQKGFWDNGVWRCR